MAMGRRNPPHPRCAGCGSFLRRDGGCITCGDGNPHYYSGVKILGLVLGGIMLVGYGLFGLGFTVYILFTLAEFAVGLLAASVLCLALASVFFWNALRIENARRCHPPPRLPWAAEPAGSPLSRHPAGPGNVDA
jgi:hypothetical protein